MGNMFTFAQPALIIEWQSTLLRVVAAVNLLLIVKVTLYTDKLQHSLLKEYLDILGNPLIRFLVER